MRVDIRLAVSAQGLQSLTRHTSSDGGRNSYALRVILGRWYGDIPLNLARYSRDLPLHGKHANLLVELKN